MSEARPANCRFRLQDEGKSYPRSSCQGCGKTIMTGLGKHCTNTRTDSIPSEDDLIRAALEAAADNAESPNLPVFKPGWGAAQDAAAISAMVAVAKSIRAMKDDPQALAAIKAKAGDRG